MKPKKQRFSGTIKYSGAIIAFLIGSGFASGQEVMQFFSVYGPYGSLYAGMLSAGILFFSFWIILRDVRRLNIEHTGQLYRHYCGRVLGGIFEWFTPIFLFLLYVVMLSGAGALLREHGGFPAWNGRFVMLGLTLFTVLLGLDRLVDIIGKIGPVIILSVVCMGAACIIRHPVSTEDIIGNMQGLPLTRAAPSWQLSGLTYASFSVVTVFSFLNGIGSKLKSDGQSVRCAALSSLSFMGAAMVLSQGMLTVIDTVYDKNIPALGLASGWFPQAPLFFAVIMFAGIYTTAVPMLWTAASRIYPEETGKPFQRTAVILAFAGFVGSALPFSRLVNLIYPLMGYLGIILLLGILISLVRPGQRT